MKQNFIDSGYKDFRIGRYGILPPFVVNACPQLEFVEETIQKIPLIKKFLTLNLVKGIKASHDDYVKSI